MFLRMELVPESHFIGMHLLMSSAADRSPELWRSFMPKRTSIKRSDGEQVYSLQVFDSLPDFQLLGSDVLYTNWAAVPVAPGTPVPGGMEMLTVPAGMYAIFLHRGPASDFEKTNNFIYSQWIPSSKYEVTNRPFFQVIQPGYRPDDPAAKEEMYVPVVARLS